MPKQPFLPKADAARIAWLNNFVDRLLAPSADYAAKYHIPAATLAQLDAGRQWANWVFKNLTSARNGSQSLTAFKNLVFLGSGAVPTTPSLVLSPPPAVPPVVGVFTLASAVGLQIKASPIYEVADGQDLGLEGAAQPLPAAETVAPDLSKSRLTSNGWVELVWRKGRFDGIKIMVDRGDGRGPVFLAVNTKPNYIDKVKPAGGQTAIYTYTAIYLLNDQEFGQWSNPVQMMVRG